MARIKAIINPILLGWARQSIGYDRNIAANKIGVKHETLQKWETGELQPSIPQLRKIANLYKRPLAIFFLPKPPRDIIIPKDFRRISIEQPKSLSPNATLEMRLAHRRRSLAIELARLMEINITNGIGNADVNEDPEELAIRERKKFITNINIQYDWINIYSALRYWKTKIEDLGILIFQTSRVALEELRGFSIPEKEYPVIVVNSNDAPSARIFSLFHEYAHLLINKGGICDMDYIEGSSTETMKIEKFCNHFSGAFLVPRHELLNQKVVINQSNKNDWKDEDIKLLSNKFKVSYEVILRRLLILDKTTESFYKLKREQLLKQYKDENEDKKDVIIPVYRKTLSKNGHKFSSMVLESYKEDKINLSDVSDYLGVRLKHLSKIQTELDK